VRFMVHDWGMIFEFFPLFLVRYLCRERMLNTFLFPRLKSLNFNIVILSWFVCTAHIPFGRYAVTKFIFKVFGHTVLVYYTTQRW
jgi:hypothetical protein